MMRHHQDHAEAEDHIDAGEGLEVAVARGTKATEELAGHGPHRWWVVPMVLLHVFPIAAPRRLVEPVDVLPEGLPPRRSEVLLALVRVLHDVGVGHFPDEIDTEISKLALRDVGSSPIVDLSHERALIEPRVAHLLEVL
jgi:hypothetical protein